MVRVATRRGTIDLAARQDDAIPDGVVFIPFAFVEAAAIGFFGDALSFGDAAKSHSLGGMKDRLDELASRHMFKYRISGDVTRNGRTHSVVAA